MDHYKWQPGQVFLALSCVLPLSESPTTPVAVCFEQHKMRNAFETVGTLQGLRGFPSACRVKARSAAHSIAIFLGCSCKHPLHESHFLLPRNHFFKARPKPTTLRASKMCHLLWVLHRQYHPHCKAVIWKGVEAFSLQASVDSEHNVWLSRATNCDPNSKFLWQSRRLGQGIVLPTSASVCHLQTFCVPSVAVVLTQASGRTLSWGQICSCPRLQATVSSLFASSTELHVSSLLSLQ